MLNINLSKFMAKVLTVWIQILLRRLKKVDILTIK